MFLLSDRVFSSCAAGTNGCLDLRHSAFALDEHASAALSRYLGSLARCAREYASIATKLSRLDACAEGRLSAGVGRSSRPITIRKASLMTGSKGGCAHCDTR